MENLDLDNGYIQLIHNLVHTNNNNSECISLPGWNANSCEVADVFSPKLLIPREGTKRMNLVGLRPFIAPGHVTAT